MKTTLSTFFFLLISLLGYPQKNATISISKTLHEAEELIYESQYYAAIDILLPATETQPTHAKLNFLIGYCYLNTRFDKPLAIEYLQKAASYNIHALPEEKAPIETEYFLAKAYHYNYEFENAIKTLNILKSKIKPEQTELLQQILHLRRSSKQAIEITDVQIDLLIENITQLNSPYDDHSPLITADESMMILTSRRPDIENKIYPDRQYSEDIYMAFNAEGEWSKPLNMGKLINTKGHESAVGLSSDGSELYIYKADNKGGSLYVSKRNNETQWTKPVKLNDKINTKYRETSATITDDNKFLIFTSDRPGGFGGLDLYLSKRSPNGEWGDARNMGEKINTSGNEDSPLYHPDGTLFFSSNGHRTMGGYDIFSTTRDDYGQWLPPYNMGAPINTVDDDYFYAPNNSGDQAYYSSEKAEGNGKTDIYSIKFDNLESAHVSVFTGYLKLYKSSNLSDVLIYATDYFSNDTIGIYTPNQKTGKFIMILPSGKKYTILFTANTYQTHQANITVDAGASYLSMQKIVSLGETILYPILEDGQKNNNDTDNQYLFSIHLISAEQKIEKESFNDLSGVKEYQDIQGNFNYYYGNFKTEDEASMKMKEIETRFPNAFIFINDLEQ